MSTRPRRLHTATAALTALALVVTLLPAPAAAAPAGGKASVLTLEGDDPVRAVSLTKALQTEFTARGLGGGREMSLAELKLTMGCDEPPAPKCLADGGKTLGVERMVYGSLTKSGGGYSVTLNLLEVGSANVQKSVTTELPASALESGQVQATAKDLVGRVLGPEKLVTPEPEVEPEPEPEPAPASSKGKLVWGRHDDVAKWKKAGLAASATLTVLSFGAALGLFLAWRRPGGPVYKKMVSLAEGSYTDDIDGNEVEYWGGADVCKNARQPLGQGVVNAAVADQCSLGETLAKANTGALVAGGIFLASTIAFTTLLFVRRDRQGGMARLQRRGFNFGASPTPTGGFLVGGGMRF